MVWLSMETVDTVNGKKKVPDDTIKAYTRRSTAPLIRILRRKTEVSGQLHAPAALRIASNPGAQ